MEMIKMSIGEIWDKVTITVAIPIGLGFAVLVVFGQLCLDNLPYLTCVGTNEKRSNEIAKHEPIPQS